jgi:hypothetical protein
VGDYRGRCLAWYVWAVMPNVAEVIRDHVTLTSDCIDLNAYVPRLQSEGGVVGFLLQHGQRFTSPMLFAEITTAFKTNLHQFCESHAIPWIEFEKGERNWGTPRTGRCRHSA